jgi:hypothetical protein
MLADVQQNFISRHLRGPVYLASSETAEIGNERLEHETTTRCEMLRHVPEALHLIFLRQKHEKRVEDDVDKGELSVNGHFRKVSLRNGEAIAARLFPQPRDHRWRGVDSVNFDVLRRQRQGNATGADAQFQRSAATRQLGQRINGVRI